MFECPCTGNALGEEIQASAVPGEWKHITEKAKGGLGGVSRQREDGTERALTGTQHKTP